MSNSGLRTVGIFVDIGNLYWCVGKKFPKRKVNYSILKEKCTGEDSVFRAIAYGSQFKGKAAKFITSLRKTGFDPKYNLIETKVDPVTQEEKVIWSSWNVQIALDAVNILDKLNVIVLCSSDQDLIPLIEHAKSRGIVVKVVAAGISAKIRSVADSCTEIDESFLLEEEEEQPTE